MSDGFESVGKETLTWNPRYTGSKKAGDLKPLAANDKSYITGFYLGTQDNVGQNNSTVHKLKMDGKGDESHISGNAEGPEVSVWGTGVLNDKIAQHVQLGQRIKITWEGLVKSKKSGNEYHAWDVAVDRNAKPLTEGIGFTPEENKAEAVATAGAEDDDLPF